MAQASAPSPVVALAERYNRGYYERVWSYTRVLPPDVWPCWPMLRELAQAAPDRLEIGPGCWPKFPVAGTHVVDLSGEVLRRLREQGAHAHAGLLAEVAFPPASFDLVGAFEVLEHVEDDASLVREVRRVLRPGGRFALSVPLGVRYFTVFDQFVGHVRRYDPLALRDLVEHEGFTIERYETRCQPPGRAGAALAVWLIRWLPRLAAWLTESCIIPSLAKKVKFDWRTYDRAEFEQRSQDATDTSLVCVKS
jgi:SAM-dependent methyltransferase